MKKLLSILVCFSLILSLNISILGVNEESSITRVKYVGTGTETYEVDVPAEIKPGEEKTVTLRGTWSPLSLLQISADKEVVMANSLDDTEVKLNVIFDNLLDYGSYTDEVVLSGSISVDSMSNYLFGDWEGVFNYSIGYLEDSSEEWFRIDEETGCLLLSEYYECDTTHDYLVIPRKINGITVTSICEDFANNASLPFDVSVKNVIIPNGVKSIGSNAFHRNLALLYISIPGSVTSIGDGAFASCWSLSNISIPDGVTELSDSLFSRCSALTTISIPKSVTTIKEDAFYECEALTKVYYGGSETDWTAINILEDGNDALFNAHIIFAE